MAEYKIIYNSLVRMGNFPLTDTEVFSSKTNAQLYVTTSGTAYAGQVISVFEEGKYVQYIVQPDGDNLKLALITSDISGCDLKNYVQVVEALPEHSAAEENVIYVLQESGSSYYKVEGGFMQVNETHLESKAPINNPTFTGTVTLEADPTEDLEAVTKQYVDRLIDGLVNVAPGIVDATNPLPTTGYKAGETWRVAAPGTYAGEVCEPGDLIICIKDYVANTADPATDFLVVQANLNGAVTGPTASTVGNIAVFDNITGTKIADSTVTIASLESALSKVHEHGNKDVLDTYTEAQADFETALKGYTDTQVTAYETAVNEKIGEIPDDTTVKGYVDNSVVNATSDLTAAIAQAKTDAVIEANAYTDNQLTLISF